MTTLTSPTLTPTIVRAEHTFRTEDGVTIFYRAWLPPRPTTRAVLLLHRGHEHSGRLIETAERLGADGDAAVFAWDMRGHGRSGGERGHADSVGQLAKDLDGFSRHLAGEHGVASEDVVVVAHSVGAVVATAWVHDYAPPIRGLVLLAPAFAVKLYVPGAIPFLRAKQKLIGGGHVTSYVRSCCLTHDRDEQRAHDADGAIFRQISVDLLLDLHDTAERLVADAGAVTTPTLVCAAGRDWVVRRGAQQRFYERLSSRVKQFEVFDGMFHDLLHEHDRGVVIDRVRSFVDECFARGPATAELDELVFADRGGHTRTEYDRLRVPAACAKWRTVRLGMRTLGRLSDGVRLGYAGGFDSGLSLDYVYANQPRGITPVGRMIDRSYLNSIGWRGIRQRRVHLERLLRRAMRELHGAGRTVRILDVAAGAGRYVLETIATCDVSATAVLRDYTSENVDAATRLAAELKLTNRVRVERGDAFDRASLAAASPRPTIGIVSGLYELFPDNAPLRRSLAGLADAIAPGGFLIYTCQPWHPQLEFIARALPNREGKPWVMRRRTQAEMDALVRAAGFEKVTQEVDRWGIFTVSLAKRVSQ
jgi:alpha-beta hydrolase superfamily lysophospholipase/SAM-dependent methyltransferase